MTQNNSRKIALIDGYGFVFRAFHALPPMTKADGTPIGAVYGFTNMLIKLLANLDVSHIAIVFDAGSKTFRNDIFSEYKANRPPCPEELKPQFSIIREVAEAFNLPILEKVGFEADDLIATIAKIASKDGFDVLIVSSDKDLMQLVDEKIIMYDALKNRMITSKEVEEKFFVKPNQVLDVLSLMGDASDNVAGVRGIGPKTAAELINQYQTLENLFENIHNIKQEKRRQLLTDGVEQAKLAKRLITLCENVPVSYEMQDYLLQNIDGAKLVEFLEKQGFRSLVAKVRKDFNVVDTAAPHNTNNLSQQSDDLSLNQSNQAIKTQDNNEDYNFDKVKKIVVDSILQIKDFIKNTNSNGNLVIDFEFFNNQPKTIILSTTSNFNQLQEIFYIPILDDDKDFNNDLFLAQQKVDIKNGIKLNEILQEILPILLNPSINKIGYNIKDIIKLFIHKIPDFSFDDIGLMAYVLDSSENKVDLDVLVADNLNDDIVNNNFSQYCQIIQKNREPKDFTHFDKKLQFFCFKNYLIWKLYSILKQRIFSDKLNNVYYCFEKPLVKVLAKIEANGILVDSIELKKLSEYFDNKIKLLTKEIWILAEEEFNIGSPKQLAQILFEKLNFQTGSKSKKTGAFSTNSEILEELDLEGHLIAGKILEWRSFSKLKSTYSDALQNAINTQTKRIHTTLSNINTTTGRLSSHNPNLQNIPIRSEEGRKIRNSFVAQKEHKLISADYSQIELRVLAKIANIKTLKQAFLADKDIHTITASEVFGVLENEVDKDMRRKAKAINFGIIYGISAFGLAKQLKISRQEAAKYIDNYFITYPGILEYMNNYQDLARKNGFVKTIIGRKCFIHNINSKNSTLRGLAERLAINSPIQGSAADIIKKAMIDFDNILVFENLKSKIILQVHDELLIEAPQDEVEKVTKLLKDAMQKAIIFDIPLKVDIKVADRWE
jgi:DNA polymerase-1